MPVSLVLPFHNFAGTSTTIGGPHRSSSFTQWPRGRGCALEGKKAALGEAALQRTGEHGGGSRGRDSAARGGFRNNLEQRPHRRHSAEEQGDYVRGDSAIPRGAEATGGGKGENTACEQRDYVRADSGIRRRAEATGGGDGRRRGRQQRPWTRRYAAITVEEELRG